MSYASTPAYTMNNSNHVYESVIVGLGQTGLSCARYLQRQGQQFAVTDNRDLPPQLAAFTNEFPEVMLVTGGFDESLVLNAGRILLSPGVSLKDPAITEAVRRGIPVIGDVELFCRSATAPVIAVTGSNGKSTVVSLLHAMTVRAGMDSRLGGNIGTPVLDLLNGPRPDLYVLEISSFQLELTRSMNARAAVVLNVSEDHMDRYETLKEYATVKAAVYNGDGVMVINRDDPLVAAMVSKDRQCIGFSASPPSADDFGLLSEDGACWLAQGRVRLLRTDEIPLRGRHNHMNALAALALGQAAGLPMAAMLDALRVFEALPHRCQPVGMINGVEWINDSKGTNVGATCAAIESLAGNNNIVLIAGGDGKSADFTPLVTVMENRVHTAITIGRDGPVIANLVPDTITHHAADSMEDAVRLAHSHARGGDKVLLSPACASLDMFTDYADRGRCFIAAVNALEQR